MAEIMKPDSLIIKTDKSVISAGTELACLSGSESWAPFPFVPGYGSVGVVVQTSSEYPELNEGDRVFTYGRHEAFSLANTVVEKLPDDADASQAVFARMAAVSIAALRVSAAELGDTVAVVGMGLVGNFAAQLFTMAGCDVIGIDTVSKRLEIAHECGIGATVLASRNLPEIISELTDGKMCRTVVDATGIPAVIEKAPLLAGKLGELILLGSPRGEYLGDLTTFLNYVHLAPMGNITIKGAHEYRFPQFEHPDECYRHSFQSNVRIILDRIQDQRLKTEQLVSDIIKPDACPRMYHELRENSGNHMGVLIDWND